MNPLPTASPEITRFCAGMTVEGEPMFSVSRTRCGAQYRFAEPGPMSGRVGPGSAAQRCTLRPIRGTRWSPA